MATLLDFSSFGEPAPEESEVLDFSSFGEPAPEESEVLDFSSFGEAVEEAAEPTSVAEPALDPNVEQGLSRGPIPSRPETDESGVIDFGDPDPTRLETAGGEFVRGAAGVGSGALRGVAISAAADARRMIPIFDALDRGEDVPLIAAPRGLGGFIGTYKIATPEERTELRRQMSSDVRQDTLFQAGEKLDAFIAEHTKSNPKFRDEFLAGKVSGGMGSMVAFMAAGLATRGIGAGGAFAPAILGSKLSEAEGFRDALGKGASIDDAYQSSNLGAIIGVSEAAPIAHILSRVDKSSGGVIKSALVSALVGGTEELVQESFTTIAKNLVASDLVGYDPERDMWTGTGDAAGVGFTTGGLMGFLTGMIGGRRRPAGEREKVTPATLSPADIASPIPDADIQRGKDILQDVTASTSANEILTRNGLPNVNSRVTVTLSDGKVTAGKVEDAFTETNEELGLQSDGVRVALDDGQQVVEFFDDMHEFGVTIEPERTTAELDLSDRAAVEEFAASLGVTAETKPLPQPAFDPEEVAALSPEMAREALADDAEFFAGRAEVDEAVDQAPALIEKAGPQAVFQSSAEEIAARLDEKNLSDDAKLLKALGSQERADRFKQLDRARNNVTDPSRADEASRQFDEEFGDTTDEQDRLIYGIGETDLTGEELKGVLIARQEVDNLDDESDVEVGATIATGMRDTDPEQIISVRQSGTGPGGTQESIVRIFGGLDELRRRGKSNAEIDDLILDGMEKFGFSRNDAFDVLSKYPDFGGRASAPQTAQETQEADLAPTAPEQAEIAPTAPETAPDEDVVSLEPARSFVRAKDGGKVSIGTLRKQFDLTHEQAKRLQARLAADGDLTKNFNARKTRTTPRDVIDIIKEMGGIVGDGDLTAMDLQKARPGVIRSTGRTVSDIREHLEEIGMLPAGSTDDAVYELVRSAIARDPARAFHPEDQHLVEAQAEKDTADEAARQIGDAIDETGIDLNDAERAAVTKSMADGTDVHDAIERVAMGTGIEIDKELLEVRDEVSDIPFEVFDDRTEQGAGRTGEEAPQEQPTQERPAEDEAGGPARGEEPGRGGEPQGVEPTTETTDQGEQEIIPGAERISEREQAERGAEGRKKSTKPQKDADEGLFDVAGRGQDDLFQRPDAPAAEVVDVEEPFTDEFFQQRADVYEALRAELDRIGLGKTKLTLPDRIIAVLSDGSRSSAAARIVNDVIHVSLEGKDTTHALHHESIHALRGAGLFTGGEWNTLERRANSEWIDEFDINERYSDLDAEGRTEEAVAEAFGNYMRGDLKPKGLVKRSLDLIKSAMEAIGSALRGSGFTTANQVLSRAGTGEVGARPRKTKTKAETKFQRKPKTDRDKTIDRIIGTTDKSIVGRARDLVTNYKDRGSLAAKQGFLDAFASIEALERADNSGELQDATTSPFKAAQGTKNLMSTMGAVLRFGPLKIEKGWFALDEEHGKGFEDIFEGIAKAGNLKLWKAWAVANRAQRLKAEGRENLISDEEIAELLPLGDEHPEFKTALKEWTAFNKKMLDMAEKVGLINAEQRSLWEKADYVPFFRIHDDTAQGGRGKRGIEGQRSGIKKLEGGESQLNDPIENMVMGMTSLVDRSFKNLAMRKVWSLAKNAGVLEPMPMGWKPAVIPVTEAVKKLKALGIGVDVLSKADKDQMVKMFQMAAPQGADVVSVMIGGKPQYARVTDPLLLRSITSMTPTQLSGVMKIMRMSKRVLTTGVTIDPTFMLRNFMRDTLSSWVTAGLKDFRPGYDSVRGFTKAIKGDVELARLMAAGAGSGGFYRTDPEDVRKLLDAKYKGDKKNLLDTPKKLWEFYQRVGQASEAANRIAIAEAVEKAGGTRAEAAFQARDIMDFAMRGDFAAMQFLAETVPFMNARAQGIYRLYRGAKQNPKGFLLRGSMITAATLAVMAANWDRPEYDELEEWDKDANYHFWVDGEHYRLPKPFEVGAIFSTVPERMIRMMAARDGGKVATERLLAMFLDTFAMNPTPQMFKPIVEQWANKVGFTNRPIVGQGLDRLEPAEQFSPWTSETARLLGRALPNFMEQAKSPKRIEHLVRGYFGALGTYVLAASDSVVRLFGDFPDKPSPRIDDFPIVKAFVRGDPARNTVYLTRFYEMQTEISKLHSSMVELRRRGAPDEVIDALRKKTPGLRFRKLLNKTRTSLSAKNRAIRRVYESRSLSPERKRIKIDRLIKSKNALARSAMRRVGALTN